MKNLHIGTRLGIAFAALLVIVGIITSIGVWRLQSVGQLTDVIGQRCTGQGKTGQFLL